MGNKFTTRSVFNSGSYLSYFIIIFVSSLLFVPFLGHVNLFDWDEINFAECAREMIVSKDYLRSQIDFMPFWEKPPLFIWLQVLAMKIFGVGAFSARLPNAVVGVVTLTTIFYVGKKISSIKMAYWWVFIYAATWLPHLYFKSGIIDPTFNYFIFLAFFQFYLLQNGNRNFFHAILTGLFLGFAVLTKGPVAILIATLSFVVYALIIRKNYINIKYILVIVLFAFLPILFWLGLAVATYGLTYGQWFVTEFLTYQVRLFRTEDSDHGGPFYYHFLVLLIGCFPASIFLFQYKLGFPKHSKVKQDFNFWMWIMFWVVLLLFSIVKTKIVHYSSLCYFPLSYLAAYQIEKVASGNIQLKKVVRVVFVLIGSILSAAIFILPVVGLNTIKLTPYINDPFAVNALMANVRWTYWECLPGLFYFIAIWVVFFIFAKSFHRSMVVLCIIQIVVIQVAIIHFTPKVEAYSQRAAIDFYKKYADLNVYVQPLGFKSYANLFYTEKKFVVNSDYYNMSNTAKSNFNYPREVNLQWLLTGNVDKPVFFICKIQDTKMYIAQPTLQVIDSLNGFVFLKRR